MTDVEIEELALEHEAGGFGPVGHEGLTAHDFDPDGLRAFVKAIEAQSNKLREAAREVVAAWGRTDDPNIDIYVNALEAALEAMK